MTPSGIVTYHQFSSWCTVDRTTLTPCTPCSATRVPSPARRNTPMYTSWGTSPAQASNSSAPPMAVPSVSNRSTRITSLAHCWKSCGGAGQGSPNCTIASSGCAMLTTPRAKSAPSTRKRMRGWESPWRCSSRTSSSCRKWPWVPVPYWTTSRMASTRVGVIRVLGSKLLPPRNVCLLLDDNPQMSSSRRRMPEHSALMYWVPCRITARVFTACGPSCR
mmetsp:Transcript_56790/g.151528  ORF Transcript_56790/g.151528 Transcript_56790/m.151528 type:complete len:219 (-) Transcript_56790:837-1493(-)